MTKIFNNRVDWGGNTNYQDMFSIPKNLKIKIENKINEMAIHRAKIEIAKRGLEPEDIKEEQLEMIVIFERDKIISEFKDKTIGTLLIMLGIQALD